MHTDDPTLTTISPEGTELARYRISAGERVLIARRLGAGIAIYDGPTDCSSPAIDVDSGFRDGAELRGFVTDYLAQARLRDACPMDLSHLAVRHLEPSEEVAGGT